MSNVVSQLGSASTGLDLSDKRIFIIPCLLFFKSPVMSFSIVSSIGLHEIPRPLRGSVAFCDMGSVLVWPG